MGVSSTANRAVYQGDGTTSNPAFSFPYYFFKTTDFLVFLYDSIAGGVTQLVLNTDYTVSGSANFQGIYPSGGTITYSDGIIPATSYIVIIRNPALTQTFNILENGIISSTALVQQLDYMTLLMQRLQDEISRCIQIPDGTAPTFSNQLPSNIPINPNSFPQVNAAGNGWVLTPAAGWAALVVPYTAAQTSATSISIPVFTLPAGAMLTGLAIKHSTAFAGSSITDVTAALGISGNTGKYIPFFDIFQNVGDQVFDNISLSDIESWANSTNIALLITSVGANLSALSAGSVTVYYQWQMVGGV